jgi:hypothetical protein
MCVSPVGKAIEDRAVDGVKPRVERQVPHPGEQAVDVVHGV